MMQKKRADDIKSRSYDLSPVLKHLKTDEKQAFL